MQDKNIKATKLINLLKFIHENKKLPKRQNDRDLFMFYTTIQQSAKIAKDKEEKGLKITKSETENLYFYMLVEDAITRYKLTSEQKLKRLIEFIRKKHRLPKITTKNSKKSERFEDGTEMRGFFDHFSKEVIKIKEKQRLNIELTSQELMYLKYDKLIQEQLRKYQMTNQEKVEELITFIYDNHRLPRPKQFNKGKSEVRYKDKTDMSKFYASLKAKKNDILKTGRENELLTIEEQEIIDAYNRIQEALCSVRITKDEKINELIAFIQKHYRLPKLGEAKFQNGKDLRNFYIWLERDAKDSMKKLDNDQTLTDIRKQNLKGYQKVQKTLSLYKMGLKEITKTDLSEIDTILNYLELLRDKNSYEEMTLLCETIIKNKDLDKEEEKKLRIIFQKYLEHAYQQSEERIENEMHDAIIKIKK